MNRDVVLFFSGLTLLGVVVRHSGPSTAPRTVEPAPARMGEGNDFMHPQQLEEKLREVMAQSSRGMSEKIALEAALNVADEWKMRLEELDAEATTSDDEE